MGFETVFSDSEPIVHPCKTEFLLKKRELTRKNAKETTDSDQENDFLTLGNMMFLLIPPP